MALIVQKFGGSSVKDAECLRRVAGIITNTYKQGNDVIVVVSAQGDTTDDLIEKAKEISKNPLYTNNYEYIFNGALGGYVDVGEYQGSYIARDIYKILSGEKNKENVLPQSTGVFMFNYKEIYNYDIDRYNYITIHITISMT